MHVEAEAQRGEDSEQHSRDSNQGEWGTGSSSGNFSVPEDPTLPLCCTPCQSHPQGWRLGRLATGPGALLGVWPTNKPETQ